MNFMREHFQTDKKKRNVSTKDINFFQTVREGTRRYGMSMGKAVGRQEWTPRGSSSSSSVVGRTFVRPARSAAPTSRGNELSVLDILEGLGQDTTPTPLVSDRSLPGAGSFFSSGVNSPPPKRHKSSPKSFWRFNEDGGVPETNFMASTSFNPPLNSDEHNSEEGTKSHLYIEVSAENECSNFRANMESFNPEEEAEAEPESPEIGIGLEGYDLSPPRAPLSDPPPAPGTTPSSPFKTPSGQVSSTAFNRFSPFLPPPSSSFSTRKTFFSDPVPATPHRSGSASKGDSFFKTPSNKTPASENPYESLFNTPGRVASLPRITTPQLFLPYPKSTPSKTTPQTKSSGKALSTPQESFYVISITEGRGHAMCEVGIAAIDLNHPDLCLSQFSDSQTYKKTLAKINIINPAEMLVPDTFKGQTPSVLYKIVSETFPDMRIVTVKRQHFSAKLGLETIRSLLLPNSSSIEMIIHRKYYTLAAAEALMKYIEIKHGKLFAPKSLKVSYQSAKDIVSIDLESCQRLEVVMSNAEMVFPEKYSLFGLINQTKTLGGKRRLRVSLLQPSSSLQLLLERQGAVTALLNDQRSLQALQTNLLKFSNVERLLWLCLKSPNFKNEVKTFETLTNYILLLKTSLEALPHLRKVLQDIDNDHIINIRDELSDNRYDAILDKILTMIQEDARPARGYAESERQRCFAIKDGINDLLDVARATYSDLIQKVMDNISDLGKEHNLPLKMVHSADFGFHPAYSLPKNATFHKEDIPEIFTEAKQKNRLIHLLTEEIYVYNMRIKRALQEIQLITNVVIYDLVESLRDEISLLYRLCEHIAELDFLSSLAQVSSTPDYTKPTFGEQTSLLGARHPILDHLKPSKPIPNNVAFLRRNKVRIDLMVSVLVSVLMGLFHGMSLVRAVIVVHVEDNVQFASKKNNFNIITGPNMGGKTVYVLMIPLIQIMAQIGCYVPAEKAEIRITDHIYVKKGSGDSLERKVSSYSKEIQELTYTVTNISDTSLIILDEICTGTLSDVGTAMAWGFCEELLKGSAFTFLTTHYHYLTNLSKIYKNVTNYNMEAIERNPDDPEYGALTFTYRLVPGVTQATNYGLRLLLSSALPDHIKKNAVEIVEDLARKRAASLPLVVPDTPNTSGLHSKIEKIENFMTNLYGLSMTDNFTAEIISILQKMAIEEILPDDEKHNEVGPRGSSDHDKEIGNPEGVEIVLASGNEEDPCDIWEPAGEKSRIATKKGTEGGAAEGETCTSLPSTSDVNNLKERPIPSAVSVPPKIDENSRTRTTLKFMNINEGIRISDRTQVSKNISVNTPTCIQETTSDKFTKIKCIPETFTLKNKFINFPATSNVRIGQRKPGKNDGNSLLHNVDSSPDLSEKHYIEPFPFKHLTELCETSASEFTDTSRREGFVSPKSLVRKTSSHPQNRRSGSPGRLPPQRKWPSALSLPGPEQHQPFEDKQGPSPRAASLPSQSYTIGGSPPVRIPSSFKLRGVPGLPSPARPSALPSHPPQGTYSAQPLSQGGSAHSKPECSPGTLRDNATTPPLYSGPGPSPSSFKPSDGTFS